MEKEKNDPLSYNKKTPQEVLMFIELIVDVFNMFKKVTWSNNSHCEIGFLFKDKITKSNIFFGIWYEAWESFGIPICITLNYTGKAKTDKITEIKKFIESKSEKGLIFKSDYNDYALILFQHEFYNFKNDAERLYNLLNELKIKLGISLN